MQRIKSLEQRLKELGAGGCTMISKDEVLHLLSGESTKMEVLKSEMTKIFEGFSLNKITYEKVKHQEFDFWRIFCDAETDCLKHFGKNVISEEEFKEVYIAGRKGVFSPFSHMADSILKRGTGINSSTADQLRPFL